MVENTINFIIVYADIIYRWLFLTNLPILITVQNIGKRTISIISRPQAGCSSRAGSRMKVNFHPSFALRKAQHKCANMPGGIMPGMNEKNMLKNCLLLCIMI